MKVIFRFLLANAMLLLACVGARAQMGAMLPNGFNMRAEVDRAANQSYKMDVGDITNAGDIKQNLHTNVNVNYTYVFHPAIRLGMGVRYDYTNETLDDVPVAGMEWGREHHTIRPTMNLMLLGKIKNTPLMIFGHVSADRSEWAFERMSGLVAGAAILKASREEVLAVGAIGIFNSASRLPCFPVAMYRRVYSPRWTLNLVYPFLGMQYTPSPKHSISAGFTVASISYWVKANVDGMPERVNYRRSMLRTGLNYDCNIVPAVRFTAQAGWEYTMRGALYSTSGNRILYEMNHPNGPYAHVGISYAPSRKK